MLYTVQRGDTLWMVAKRFLGHGSRWPNIKVLNRDVRKSKWRERIYPGDKLEIPMAMSKDRVEFNLVDYDKQQGAMINAAVKALGMTQSEARQAVSQNARIRCRPSQFARFLIYRSEEVEINRFSCLEAKLIEADKPLLLDVSDRPRG